MYRNYQLRYREKENSGKILTVKYKIRGIDIYDASMNAVTGLVLDLIWANSLTPGQIYSSVKSIEIKDHGRWMRVSPKDLLIYFSHNKKWLGRNL